MKPLTRDVIITLIVKFSLLLALWLVCFKSVDKAPKDMQAWMLGSSFVTEPHSSFSD